jgi:hypothetical protein
MRFSFSGLCPTPNSVPHPSLIARNDRIQLGPMYEHDDHPHHAIEEQHLDGHHAGSNPEQY